MRLSIAFLACSTFFLGCGHTQPGAVPEPLFLTPHAAALAASEARARHPASSSPLTRLSRRMELMFNIPPDPLLPDSLLRLDFARWTPNARLYRDPARMARSQLPVSELPPQYMLIDIRPVAWEDDHDAAFWRHPSLPDSLLRSALSDSVLRSTFVVSEEMCPRWPCGSVSWVTVTRTPAGWLPGSIVAMLVH